jgi:hypothetical protein
MALSTEEFVKRAMENGLEGNSLREATAEYIRSQKDKKAPGFLQEQKDIFSKGLKATKHYIKNPGEFSQDRGEIARSMSESSYRNIGKEASEGIETIDKAGQFVEKAAPVISGTVGNILGTITNPGNREAARRVGAAWSGYGQAAGTLFRETSQNIAGIQDDSPLGTAVKPVAKAATTAAIDYGIDWTLERFSNVTAPIWESVKEKMSQTGPAKIINKATNWMGDKFKKQSADNLLSEMKTTKTLRREAAQKNIDLTDVIFATNKNGDLIYGTDIVRNAEIAERQIVVASAKLDKVLPENTFNIQNVINKTIYDTSNEIRSKEQQEAVKSWAQFQVDNIIDKYGNVVVNNQAALAEKILAGQSGFSESGVMAEQIKGSLDAKFAMNLKDEILKNVSGANKIRLKKLFREQETAILMTKIFKEGIISQAHKSLRRKIGSLFFPTSFMARTIGAGAEVVTDKFTRSTLTNKSVTQSTTASLADWLKTLGIETAAPQITNEIFEGNKD